MTYADMRALFDDIASPEMGGRFVVERATSTPDSIGGWHVVLRDTGDGLYYQLSIYYPFTVAARNPMPIYGFTGIEPGQFTRQFGQRQGHMTWDDILHAFDHASTTHPAGGLLDVARTTEGGYACLVYNRGARQGNTLSAPAVTWAFSAGEASHALA